MGLVQVNLYSSLSRERIQFSMRIASWVRWLGRATEAKVAERFFQESASRRVTEIKSVDSSPANASHRSPEHVSSVR